MTTPVTLVTRDATLDDLSVGDYRDMVIELRGMMSIDKMIAALGSTWSKALWAKVEHGEAPINRSQRNELRRYFGKPELPPTVAEATGTASPDAAVWQVGNGPAEHVIMVTVANPVTISVNGSVTVADYSTHVACNHSNTPLPAQVRARRHVTRPTPSRTQVERFSRLSTTWRTVIDKGLAAMEAEVQP